MDKAKSTARGYKVPGAKMKGQHGYSHRETRLINKHEAPYYPEEPKHRKHARALKHCKHKRWVDESYGGPDSGGDGGHCKDCGFGFWHQYY